MSRNIKICVLVAALFACVPFQALSYPDRLGCSTSLEAGSSIMGVAAESAGSEPDHWIRLKRDGAVLDCGSTVDTSDSLEVELDNSTLAEVTADGFNMYTASFNFLAEVEPISVAVFEGEGVSAKTCDVSGSVRVASTGNPISVKAVAGGEIKLRLAWATGYGVSVTVSEDCAYTVTGEVPTVTHTGFLVDKLCWEKDGHVAIDGSKLGTEPHTHTVHCLWEVPACRDSGYVLLEKVSNADGTFQYELKYELDAAGNANAVALLKAIFDDEGGDAANIQVSATGKLEGTTLMDATLTRLKKGDAGWDDVGEGGDEE
eukprot:CAMPEP_0181329128 /NCGR_PEP_ID=MMETSP1101-20121128/23133_1 /TAXON_ID=46948 /ORGANISM="Rhodomonas abbreviata, Strain Caron Lab Isolate" /LENGTH=315 /DNA_ID=CAMNT_0023438161 /DNA_START=17 /DNA_END=961 /DNA_ORIENTATION=+